jgi:hypothetical protein
LEAVVDSGRIIEETRGAGGDRRLGWDEAFRQMAERGDDAPLLPGELGDSFDAEWDW